jgi:muramidase (phage lysozyme)
MNNLNKLMASAIIIKRASAQGSVILPAEEIQKLNARVSPPQQPKLKAQSKPKAPSKQIVQSYYNPVLEAIRKAESRVADYDTMVRSNKRHNLTGMTLKQVMDYQKSHKPGSAAGAYQIIAPTMKGLVSKMKLNPEKDVYNKDLQDRMALHLLQQRGFDSYLSGKLPISSARTNLAKEWAGLPNVGGKSYYSGTGNNAARISEKEFLHALEQSRKLYLQNQVNK